MHRATPSSMETARAERQQLCFASLGGGNRAGSSSSCCPLLDQSSGHGDRSPAFRLREREPCNPRALHSSSVCAVRGDNERRTEGAGKFCRIDSEFDSSNEAKGRHCCSGFKQTVETGTHLRRLVCDKSVNPEIAPALDPRRIINRPHDRFQISAMPLRRCDACKRAVQGDSSARRY